MANRSAEFIGVDISPTAIAYANDTYATSPNSSFVEADLCQSLPSELALDSFDLGISSEVIEHVPDVFVFLSNLSSLLKADGVAIVGTPNRRWSRHYLLLDIYFVRHHEIIGRRSQIKQQMEMGMPESLSANSIQ